MTAEGKENEERMEWWVLGLAGKRNSQKWSDSYNVENVSDGEKYWVNLREYKNTRKMNENFLASSEGDQVLKAKLRELQSWEENAVLGES